jgi:uncharacterized repeat protein (TIGR03803 family)
MQSKQQFCNSLFRTISRAATAALALAIVLTLTLILTTPAQAQSGSVIYNFTGGIDGAYPSAGLTVDAAGNLYGTTCGSGIPWCTGASQGNGTVFRLSRNGSGWVFSTLYTFRGGSDGLAPLSRVIFGPDGSLYGTTVAGGIDGCGSWFWSLKGCGTVFKLTPPAQAAPSVMGGWTETVLYRFTGGVDGGNPAYGDLNFDQSGTIYGTTAIGGAYGAGAVYELTPARGGWTESVLYSFDSSREGEPLSGVIFDESGKLYGTALFGGYCSGGFSCGEVYQLSPSTSGWTENVLYTFRANGDGAFPVGGVVFDRNGYGQQGPLTGTTSADSWDGSGGGTLWGAYFWTIQHFTGNWPGSVFSGSWASLTAWKVDPTGLGYDFVGTTCADGQGYGSIFSLVWTCQGCYCYQAYSALWEFAGGSGGAFPISSVAFDPNNHAYVTTQAGGTHGMGTVFRLSNLPADQVANNSCTRR